MALDLYDKSMFFSTMSYTKMELAYPITFRQSSSFLNKPRKIIQSIYIHGAMSCIHTVTRIEPLRKQ